MNVAHLHQVCIRISTERTTEIMIVSFFPRDAMLARYNL